MNAMEREMESLRKWEAEKSEMTDNDYENFRERT